MMAKRFPEEQVELFSPIVDRLLTMMGAARDAFNRHSRSRLEELQSLQRLVEQAGRDTATELQALGTQTPEDEKPALIRSHSILEHLQAIGGQITGCRDPIDQKISGGILFSDKAVTQANFLFDQHSGIIRSVLDIFKTDNDFLKQYVLEESRKLGQACLTFATEHETRLIEGICLPQAAPIFLALLDRMGAIAQQEMQIADLLAGRS
jgi:Na+/phosphate symporter